VSAANILGLGRDYTDEEVRSFVGDLESLPSGDLTVSLLVGCGQRAVAPLRDYLLHGQPRGIFQPRQRAVEALAQLGAKEVLIEYLSQKRMIPDFEVRFGEEAVENTAARALSQWPTDDVFAFLCSLAERRMLAGAIEALGKFDRFEAAWILIRALGDDVCHPVAEEALRRIAETVKPLLLQASRRVNPEYEKPSERQRRRSVVRILSDLPLTLGDWEELRPLLADEDKTITRTVAQVAVDRASETERERAVQFLIRSLGSAPWFEQMHIQECLERNYSAVRHVIDEESALRRETVKGPPLADSVLRILEKIGAKCGACELKETGRNAK
jgi:HEAT repeat protein